MRTATIFYKITVILIILGSCGCRQTPKADAALLNDPDLLHRNIHQLTQVIIYDVFSPPVSSRIYAYTSLAAYEVLRFQDSAKPSIVASLQGFSTMPQPEKGKAYNFLLAATKAY
ncbi:MAG TPA: hypothetical protein VM884_10750, partial [Flavisolibacter sp.]|nr:hypothetical protein [Flavisolibacter sp.]